MNLVVLCKGLLGSFHGLISMNKSYGVITWDNLLLFLYELFTFE